MESSAHQPGVPDSLVLRSSLSEMERLPGWVDAAAIRFDLDDRLRFAVQLCLEEVISNIIQHGYGNVDGHRIAVRCTKRQDGWFICTVDDDASPFNPLEGELLPTIGDQGPYETGGQGIRLLRRFADLLEYEPKLSGNRLRLGFRNGLEGHR